MHENGTSSGSFRQVRWFHIAALAAVIGGSLILANLTAKDLKAVGSQLATTNLGQTGVDGLPIYSGYAQPYDGPSAFGLGFPQRIGLDPVNHRLIVESSAGNNGKRVGFWQLNADDTIGSRSLFATLGQTTIKGFATGASQSTFASDNTGFMGFNPSTQELAVPDPGNNRVMIFDVADVGMGEDATDLLGQLDENGDPVFMADDTDGPLTGHAMNNPQGVALDSVNHRLFVADAFNNRILVFDLDLSDVPLDGDADAVLGQDDFSENEDDSAQNRMSSPTALAYDPAGDRLFVADEGNQRVTVFDTASIDNGEDAANVLGWADFDFTGCAGGNACTVGDPTALAYDSAGQRLFVGDNSNNRIMVFNVAAITDGEDAVNVLGHSDFNFTPCGTPGQCDFLWPSAIAYDDDAPERLFVADQDNSQVLVFDLSDGVTDGEDAVNVLGKADFVLTPCLGASLNVNQCATYGPSGLAFDETGDRLFVAQGAADRVTVFDVAAITDGEDAVNVLGQEDYDTFESGPAADRLRTPRQLAYGSAAGVLYVADSNDNRVVGFDAGTITDGEDATIVLGQATFTTNASNDKPNARGLDHPEAATYDTVNHRLFVSDKGNNRVLVFDLDAGDVLIDRIADHVLGQPDFSHDLPNTSSVSMASPTALAYDAAGDRLFVSDTENDRVLVFDTATIDDGEGAVNVLGQPDFVTSFYPGPLASSFDDAEGPAGLAVDDADRLYVADVGNNRVLVFDILAITNGEDAVNVLGQEDFVSNAYAIDADSLANPRDVVFSSAAGLLYVVDVSNNRIMAFDVGTITDGEDAVDVLAQTDDAFQPSFVYGGINDGPNKRGFYYPSAVFMDPANQRLWISDGHRLTERDLDPDGELVDLYPQVVLGQDTFKTEDFGTSQTLNNGLGRMAVTDDGQRLFVTDVGNHRLLVYDFGMSGLASGMPADFVIGQPLFTSGTSGGGTSGLQIPLDAVYDPTGQRLFVADAFNHRVMVFDVSDANLNAEATGSGIAMDADHVLGQPDFVTTTPDTTQTTLAYPEGLALDIAGQRLFVADTGNDRVMVFDVTSVIDGEPAVAVLGKADFTTAGSDVSQAGLSSPLGMAYDPDTGTLFVSDSGAHRVMVFDTTAISDGEDAIDVIGQTNFASSGGGIAQGKLSGPAGLGWDAALQRLYVADQNNQRIMVFDMTLSVDGGGDGGGGGGGGGFLPPPSATPTSTGAIGPSPTVPGATVTPRRTPLGSRTPTPTMVAVVSPGTSATPGAPASPGPSTAPGPGIRSALDRLLGGRTAAAVLEATSMLLAAISIIAILLSAILLSRNLMDLAFMGAFALQSLWVILGLKKRAHIWGTVYDVGNKHPIPFAKVELTDLNGRVLETRFADRDGRYGFLASPDQVRQQSLTVRIKPTASGYLFPPLNAAEGATDFLVYDHVYAGGPVTVAADSFLRFDIPMYRQPWRATRFSEFFPIKSAGGFMSHVMNIAFWAGVILVPLAYWQQPTTLNLVILILFFGVHALRMLTGMYRPFGVVRDIASSKAVPYALVTLNDATGKRRTFAVSDEQGRYFMSSDSGTYQLQTFTPANISPQRSQTTSVTTSSGWVKKKLAV